VTLADTLPRLSPCRRLVLRFLDRVGESWQTATAAVALMSSLHGAAMHPETYRRICREMADLGHVVRERLMPGAELPDGYRSGQGTCVTRINDAYHAKKAGKIREAERRKREREACAERERTAAADRARYSAPPAVLLPLVEKASRRPLPAALTRREVRGPISAAELDAALAARPPELGGTDRPPEPPDD